MTSYYHAHASHTAPSHEPTDELVSAATQAWGMLYAQPNKVSFTLPSSVYRSIETIAGEKACAESGCRAP